MTRLIKASKNQKPTRDTILATSGSSSSLSFVKPEVQIGSKLAAAQSELQACEAHLATKERELDMMRTLAVRTGLQVRCKALVECGWQWGEMGKEGLRALETLDIPTGMNGHGMSNGPRDGRRVSDRPEAHQTSQLPYNKPLPDSGQSDLSSIGPSQSASQNTHQVPDTAYTLNIPPAHSISDHIFPNGSALPQVDERGGSSDEEDSEAQYEVHENQRFSPARAKSPNQGNVKVRDRSPPASASRVQFPASASAPPVVTRSKPRQRQHSGVFGSIAAFFSGHSKNSNAGSDDEKSAYVSDTYTSSKSSSKWKTRTDKHLRKRDSSDDEIPSTYPRSLPPDPLASISKPAAESSQRLRKRSTKRSKAKPPVKAQTTREEKGWSSDTGQPSRNSTLRAKKSKEISKPSPTPAPNSTPPSVLPNGPAPAKSKKGKDVEILKISDDKNTPPSPATPTSPTIKGKKPNGTALSAVLPTEVSLSRNSSLSKHSITSVASVPVMASPTTIHPANSSRHSHNNTHNPPATHKRTTSLDASTPRPSSEAIPSKGHRRTLSNPAAHPEPQSLMSIVAGVAKQNREHQDPNSMLFLPKAPPPVSESIDFNDVVPNHSQSADTSSLRIEREPSERSVPLMPSVSAPMAPTIHHPSPDLKPLRSALRNSSRSPSPLLASLAPPALPVRSTLRPSPPPAVPSKKMERVDSDDVSSISSYETTREMLDDEDASTPVQAFTTPTLPSPAPLPPPKPAATVNGANAGGSDVSQSTNSSNAAAPTRRKSVRMSLPPTFSATPPAFEDEQDSQRYIPWSSPPNGNGFVQYQSGWSSRIRERDMWQDSSDDEEEEYSKAKRLLSRIPLKTR